MNWNLFKKITYQSPINGEITLGTQKNEKAIFAGGVTQSGGELVSMWDTVIGELYRKNFRVKHFLLLGVGAGMIFRVIKHYYPKAKMVGIEIDPVMKQIAIEQFDWKDTKSQEIIIADAISWLRNDIPKKKFDLIAVDLFIGPFNAPKTRSKKFLESLKKRLNSKGVILYNTHYRKENPNEYKKFCSMLKPLFESKNEVFSYPLNRVLLLEQG